MDSVIKYISNAAEFQDALLYQRSLTEYHPSVWNLAPGCFELAFDLPPFIKIKGSGLGLTILKLVSTCCLESNNIIEDVTIEYSHENLTNETSDSDSLQLFLVNCVSYLDQMYQPTDLIFTNQVVFRNCQIELYNLESGYIFNVLVGNLKLENVTLTHQLLDKYSQNVSHIHNLFTLNYLCHLELEKCKIEYETKFNPTFLFSGNISQLDINDSEIILKSKCELDETYLFYLISTKLNIKNSILKNQVSAGNLFFWDTENNLEFLNLISNFQIEKGKMIIQKIGDDKNTWRLVSFLSGFSFQNQRYIFQSIDEREEKYIIELDRRKEIKDCELQVEPDVKMLFLVSISHSFLLDANDKLLDNFPDIYLFNLQNVTYQNKKNILQLSDILDKKISYVFDTGALQVEQLEVERISSLQMSQIFRCDQGYSLLDKTKVGLESIDLTLGNSSVTGIYSFASGLDTEMQGNYSSVLGNYNKVTSSHSITLGSNLCNNTEGCLVLGKYNQELDDVDTILVVGNGKEDKRSNALTISQSGNVKIYNQVTANTITDGFCEIKEGNIQRVRNIEVEGHLFVNNTLEIEGSVEGYPMTQTYMPTRVLEIGGEIITTGELDLADLVSPDTYGSLIYQESRKNNYLMEIEESVQGIIYQMEIICVETPNRQDIRFLVSTDSTWRKEKIIEDNFIDLVSSYEWKKGKRIVAEEVFKFDWDYNHNPYYLYLAREIHNPHYLDYGEKKMSGKFLIRIKAAKIF